MIDRRQWYRAIKAERRITRATKDYAEWLITRPVKGQEDTYKGGQQAAATAIGATVRTVHNAEQALVAAGWLKMKQRGVKARTMTTWELRSPNMQKLPVITETKHAHGVRFENGGLDEKTSASMTKPPLRIVPDHRPSTERYREATARSSGRRPSARSSLLRPSSGTERVAGFRRHSTTAGRSRPSHPLAGAIA